MYHHRRRPETQARLQGAYFSFLRKSATQTPESRIDNQNNKNEPFAGNGRPKIKEASKCLVITNDCIVHEMSE